MKVKSITIEEYNKVSKQIYEFDNFGYLKGPNGSGKTTVLQAIQLALLGYIPGLNKTAKDVIFNHSKDGKHLGVNLVLDNKGELVVLYRSWDLVKSTIKTDSRITPTGYKFEDIVGNLELPVFNFNEFAGMTANKLKDWFLDFLPKSNVELNWTKELHDSLSYQHQMLVDGQVSEFLNETISDLSENVKGVSGVDAVRAANTYFKNCVSFEKKEIDRITGAIQSIAISEDLCDPSAIIELRPKVEKLHSDLVDIQAKKALYASQETIRLELEQLSDVPSNLETSPEYTQLKIDLTNAENGVKIESDCIDTLKSTIQTLTASYQSYMNTINGNGVCPFTNSDCESIKNMIPDIEDKLNHTKKAIVEAKERLAEHEQLLKECSNKVTLIERLISNLTSKISRKSDLLTQVKNVVVITDEDVLDAKNEYELENTRYNNILANLKAKKMLDQFTEQKYVAEIKLEMYKTWEKHTGVNGLQSDSRLGNPFELFESKMDQYISKLFMDENTSSKFYVDGKANSFSFGIIRNDRYIKYDDLSSGEKCLFTLSMLMSIIAESNAPLKLLVVDDLLDHLDSEKINNLFSVLVNQTEIQIICAGVKEVSSEFDDYITEIR